MRILDAVRLEAIPWGLLRQGDELASGELVTTVRLNPKRGVIYFWVDALLPYSARVDDTIQIRRPAAAPPRGCDARTDPIVEILALPASTTMTGNGKHHKNGGRSRGRRRSPVSDAAGDG